MRAAALPLLHRAADALFPPACPLCRAEAADPGCLCSACWTGVAFLEDAGCRHCRRPIPGALPGEPDLVCDVCLAAPPLWRHGVSVFRYEDTGRRLVLGLKHGDRLDMVGMLGAWALRAGAPLVAGADRIAPVPLHWTRRLKRRGNQAAWLARWLARAGGKPDAYAPRLLVRQRRTLSQDGKNRAAREANVAGAFLPGPSARLDGQTVLLVDDVLTTGATLNEAARVCLAHGALAVDVLVLALVMREPPDYIVPATDGEDDGED